MDHDTAQLATADRNEGSTRGTVASWLVQDSPYILLLLVSLVGVAWTSLSGRPGSGYWILMTPVAAAICIVAGWRHTRDRDARIELLVTQVLQWMAVLIAMYLTQMSDVRGLLNDDSVGLTFLTLVALAVFISGLHVRAWRLCVVGAFLAVAVPVLAWVERAALLLIAGAAALIALSFVGWWFRGRPGKPVNAPSS